MQRTPPSFGRVLKSLLGFVSLVMFSPGLEAQEETESSQQIQERLGAAVSALPPAQRDWVRSVFGLITVGEIEYFVAAPEYRRDAFVSEFWRVRDPDPRTTANEFKERFDELSGSMGPSFSVADPRFRLFLLNGPPSGWSLPDGRAVSICLGRTRELEIWFYRGSARSTQRFIAVFQRRAQGRNYELWRPGDTLRPVQRSGLPSKDVRVLCADELMSFVQREISRIGNYDQLMTSVLEAPKPPPEWLAGLKQDGVDVPEGATTFDVLPRITFPSRRQSRTGMQVLVPIPRTAAPGRRFGENLVHNFELVGEILRDGRLFEEFRYRFEGPTDESADVVPLGFTRFLRQGPAKLRLRIEDVLGSQFASVDLDLEVPSAEGRPAAVGLTLAQLRPAGKAVSLRLMTPGEGAALAGRRRFETRATGRFDRVAFFLDGRQVLAKRNPPYSVELDLGETPAPHTVRVVGYLEGEETATDQLWLNQGQQRFDVRLIEPRPGGLYPGGLTARAAVQVPVGQEISRVDFFLDDEKIESLEAEPYRATVRIEPRVGQVVRVVAFLADGAEAEDAVVVGGASFEETVEVTATELFFRAVLSGDRPVGGLALGDVSVAERSGASNGESRYPAETLEPLSDARLQVALVVDTSISMQPDLADVQAASAAFVSDVVSKEEEASRVGVLTFAEVVQVASPLAPTPELADQAVAGFRASGRTALFDALVESLRFVDGAEGPEVIVLVTDGEDDSSLLTYEQTLASVEASGAVLMIVAIEDGDLRRPDRRRLRELAEVSGGRVAFVPDASELRGALLGALAEVRGGYRLTYTSAEQGDERVRDVEVRIAREGVTVSSRSRVRD